MFFLEQDEYTLEEAKVFLEAKMDAGSILLKEAITDPIIKVLNEPKNRMAYVQLGTEFLQANSEMLSREFPTKPVSFPRLYVDNVFKLFGFTQKQFKEDLKEILKSEGFEFCKLYKYTFCCGKTDVRSCNHCHVSFKGNASVVSSNVLRTDFFSFK